MNPRVKEASKKITGSLKSLDVAPAQHYNSRSLTGSQCSHETARNTYAGVTADIPAVMLMEVKPVLLEGVGPAGKIIKLN